MPHTRNRPARGRVVAAITALTLVGLALTGCGDGPGAAKPDAQNGSTVTIFGTITGDEGTALEAAWTPWAKEQGITIRYESSKDFESQIAVRAQGGKAPDIALFSQPGLLDDLIGQGYVKPLPDEAKANLDRYWSKDWAAYGTVDGTEYAFPAMSSVKGYTWYQPALFKKNGWAVPKSWEELLNLTALIQQKTGKAPWCAGFAAQASTGWPGTDWVEGALLRRQGPKVYDDWVAHRIPFTDERVRTAFTDAGDILLNPKYVNAGFGDVASIGRTEYGDVAARVADGTCALTQQATFLEGFLTKAGAKVAPDGDVWAFPTPAPAGGTAAVTGGGDLVAAFTDGDATAKVLAYLSSPDFANARVKAGGALSANTGLDPKNASSPLLADAIRILQDPKTTFRFDGSDLMPGAVGTGTFLKAFEPWLAGRDLGTILRDIESGWASADSS